MPQTYRFTFQARPKNAYRFAFSPINRDVQVFSYLTASILPGYLEKSLQYAKKKTPILTLMNETYLGRKTREVQAFLSQTSFHGKRISRGWMLQHSLYYGVISERQILLSRSSHYYGNLFIRRGSNPVFDFKYAGHPSRIGIVSKINRISTPIPKKQGSISILFSTGKQSSPKQGIQPYQTQSGKKISSRRVEIDSAIYWGNQPRRRYASINKEQWYGFAFTTAQGQFVFHDPFAIKDSQSHQGNIDKDEWTGRISPNQGWVETNPESWFQKFTKANYLETSKQYGEKYHGSADVDWNFPHSGSILPKSSCIEKLQDSFASVFIHRAYLEKYWMISELLIREYWLNDSSFTGATFLRPGMYIEPPMIGNIENRRLGYLEPYELMGALQDQYSDLFPIITQDDRLDLMILPNQDYPYVLHPVIDENGVPYEPLSSPRVPDVLVKHPLNHPFPSWAQVGTREIWVNLWVLKDIILHLIQIWRFNLDKFNSMSLHQALMFLLEQLYQEIEPQTAYVADYERVFRLTRWYAERLILQNTALVLRRFYKDWADTIRSSGQIGCPAVLDGFQADQTSGMVRSILPNARLQIQVTNYIDGVFSFSYMGQTSDSNSSSELSVQIDGTFLDPIPVISSPHRISYPVPAGTHTIIWEWSGKEEEQVFLSGFLLSGAVFQGAEVEFKDPGTLQGAKAIHLLLADLMKYYQDHWDQDKIKGHLGIQQRKPWINS